MYFIMPTFTSDIEEMIKYTVNFHLLSAYGVNDISQLHC